MKRVIPKRPEGDPNSYNKETVLQEMFRVSDNDPDTVFGVLYWISNYVKILDNKEKSWVPFDLWDTEPGEYDNQVTVALKLATGGRWIVLKARQLGLTWIVIAIFLWNMLYYPIVTALFISRGELEAKEALARMKGMYNHLPVWMRAAETPSNSKTEWSISNGSSVRALSTRRGDSYSASHVLVDEAALIHEAGIDLSDVLLKVEPTVGKSGMLVLLSKADKSQPSGTFANIYKAAERGETSYRPVFLPYYIHPDRDAEWYERQKKDSIAIDGSTDALFESYPRTPEEALAPLSVSKRLPFTLINKVYHPEQPLVRIDGSDAYWLNDEPTNDDIPIIHGLNIYRLPEDGLQYLVIIDPAEGGQTGDDSCAMVMRVDNKEEVATLAIKAEPAQISYFADILAHFYNNARVIHERNNHGHAVKLWFEDHSDFYLLEGWDHNENKPGWLNNSLGKNLGYDKLADVMAKEDCIIHDQSTYSQLASIERVTLRAPKSEPDDRAVCFMIGCAAIEVGCIKTFRLDFIKIK